GQDADRVHEIEFARRKLVPQEVAFDERQPPWRGHDVSDGMTGSIEHRLRRVNANEASHVTERPEISAGAAPKIQRVDRAIEAVADVVQPLAQPGGRVLRTERLVVITVAFGVRLRVELDRPGSPPRARLGAQGAAPGSIAITRGTGSLCSPRTRSRRRRETGARSTAGKTDEGSDPSRSA